MAEGTGWAILDVVNGVMDATRAGNLGEAIEVVTDPDSGIEVSDNTAEILDIAANVVGLGATAADVAAAKAPIEEAMGGGAAAGPMPTTSEPWAGGMGSYVPGAQPFWGGGDDDDVIDVGDPHGGGMVPGGGGLADELEGMLSGIGVAQLANILLRRYPQARALVTALGGLLGLVIGDRAGGGGVQPPALINDAGNMAFYAEMLSHKADIYRAIQLYRQGVTMPLGVPKETLMVWQAILVAQSNTYIAPWGCKPSDHCTHRTQG